MIGESTTAGRVYDTSSVGLEDPATGVDCDCNWLFGNYGLHSFGSLRLDADVSLQLHPGGYRLIVVAFFIYTRVWPVCFAVDLIVHGILESIPDPSTMATHVLGDTGNELLLREVA